MHVPAVGACANGRRATCGPSRDLACEVSPDGACAVRNHVLARLRNVRAIPTAPVAAGTLIVGYAVAVSTGSRPLGGVVLLIGGLWCARVWVRRHGPRTALKLVGVGLFAFVGSHLLALAIGAWPAVLVLAAGMAVAAWAWADSQAARTAAF
jgi:hypothetical protein